VFELAESGAPLYLRIADAVAAAIRRGRVRAGERLPSTRELAKQLGVHRKTVGAAYTELMSQGLVATAHGRTTMVARALPPAAAPSPGAAVAQSSGFELDATSTPFAGTRRAAGLLTLLGGVPELRFEWPAELARAYGRALRRRDGYKLLDYGDPRGDDRLRAALADLLRRTRGVHATPDHIVVLRGALQGLYVAARTLLRPGDRVAVEALAHPAAIGILRVAGAEVEPIPVDGDGLDVDALARLCRRERVRAVYVTPCHQLPTTVTLAPARRAALLGLARDHGLVVLEDDYDHEFHYDGPPPPPLAAADRAGVVVHLGTFSKVLAPGLRLGYVVATPDVATQLARYRTFVDQHGDRVQERAIAELLEDGDLERFVRRARRTYQARRDALCAELRAQLPALELEVPRGGMAVWLRAPGVDTGAWAERAYAAGVAFQPGAMFSVAGAFPEHARVGFASCTPRELAEAVRRMARTFEARD
jgi:GntR family transcriptional regulator/MocR family aminotransferase